MKAPHWKHESVSENQRKIRANAGRKPEESGEIRTDHTLQLSDGNRRWRKGGGKPRAKAAVMEQHQPAELFRIHSSSHRLFTDRWAHVATPLRLKRSGGNQNPSAQLAENQTLKAECGVENGGENWEVKKKKTAEIYKEIRKIRTFAHFLTQKTLLCVRVCSSAVFVCVCVCVYTLTLHHHDAGYICHNNPTHSSKKTAKRKRTWR